MKYLCILLAVIVSAAQADAQQLFQLAPPLLKYRSVFFKDTITVTMAFAQKGTTVYYTANGTEPGLKSNRYTGPVVIHKHLTTIRAKVFGKQYLPSETVEATFIQQGLPVKEIKFTAPHPQYSGNGNPGILNDNQGGSADFTSKNWLGFQQDTAEIYVQLKQQTGIHAVLFNMLQDYGSWIFFPARAELLVKDEKGQWKKMDEMKMEPQQNKMQKTVHPFVFNISKAMVADKVLLRLHLLKSIPAWHPGSGQPGWMFIDEIKIY